MNNDNNSNHLPLSEAWDDCDQCLKPVSATRPPILNSVNCSCAERASFSNGHGQDTEVPYHTHTVYNQVTITPLFHIVPLDYTFGHVAPSNTSSNTNDINGQHGVEIYAPNLTNASFEVNESPQEQSTTANCFLPLNSGTTDNENIARRSFFFHSRLPYTMQNYLNTQDEPYASTFHTEHEPSLEQHYTLPGGFLDQGMQFGKESMVVAAQTSRRSKLSYRSSAEHSSSESRSWHVFQNMDGTVHVGGWMDHDGDVYEDGYDYPLHLSGVFDAEE